MTLRQENKNLYWAWKGIKQRCQTPKCVAYRNYGARGIKVCDEWQKFEPFLEWALNNGYEKGLDLDRRDNDGDYTPDNCRWITRRENLNNRRSTIMIDVDGEILPETIWSEKLGVDRALLKLWLKTHGAEYTADRIRGILKDGYRPRDFGYSHRKRVLHEESGMVFESTNEAAKYFGISSCNISSAIKAGRKTTKGRFTYEILS